MPDICGCADGVFKKENIMSDGYRRNKKKDITPEVAPQEVVIRGCRYGFIKDGSSHVTSITDLPFNPPTSEYRRVEVMGQVPRNSPYLYDPETKTLSTDEEAYEANQKATKKRSIVNLFKQKAGLLQAQEDSGLDYSEEISEIQAKIDNLVLEITS